MCLTILWVWRLNEIQMKCYLTELYKQRLQDTTINNHRSEFFTFHEQVQGKPIGEHSKVCALLVEGFNRRSPQAKYCFIWNVEKVIDFITKE